jgi:hypothetical protein
MSCVEASGALTLKGVSVMPDTPMEALTAWNLETLVCLVMVSKSEICGARVGNGEVDFLACAGPVDWPGGTSCMGNPRDRREGCQEVECPQDIPPQKRGPICHPCECIQESGQEAQDILYPHSPSRQAALGYF